MQAHRLTEATLHAIPVDGFAQGFRDCEADFGSVFLVRRLKAERRKIRAGKSETLIIDFAEVATAENSDVLRKTEQGQTDPPDDRIWLGYLLGVADVPLVANGQLMAAFRPSAGQHGASVFGLHALAEAVSFGALPIIRLKRTFWHCS
jgi:hypothetical protein